MTAALALWLMYCLLTLAVVVGALALAVAIPYGVALLGAAAYRALSRLLTRPAPAAVTRPVRADWVALNEPTYQYPVITDLDDTVRFATNLTPGEPR
jgi:hypothetical protein